MAASATIDAAQRHRCNHIDGFCEQSCSSRTAVQRNRTVGVTQVVAAHLQLIAGEGDGGGLAGAQAQLAALSVQGIGLAAALVAEHLAVAIPQQIVGDLAGDDAVLHGDLHGGDLVILVGHGVVLTAGGQGDDVAAAAILVTFS